MPQIPDAGYRDIAGWPDLGDKRKLGELALLAVEWIWVNQAFIQDHLTTEEGFDHRDVISLMMFRAHNGGGLVLPLQAHADGTAPIGDPKGLLLNHVYWAAGECRSHACVRRETATDWFDHLARALPATWDEHDNASGFLRLITILVQECGDALDGSYRDGDLLAARQHVTGRLPDLWAIFCRYAPTQVSERVASWDDDDRACLLLAVWPAQLPHRAVTAYRRMTSGADRGEMTVAATQRKISRLRMRLRMLWPPELAPPGHTAAGSLRRGDDGWREES
jgi:hypothetical protein